MRSATHRPSLVTVRFVPADVSAEVPSGTTAAEAAARARVALALPCGGKGACGNCRVRVVSGLAGVSDADRARLPPEAIEDGWRLACALAVEEDITLEHRSGAATVKTGFGAGDVPEPVHTVR